ncbi:hypothetical protein V7S57_02360 [Caulobacter sp. CCNWLY153]|uniref:hypothetical protein n=1 Tax=unclassified Caulobacter TaxID=2648921 RepID=UPI002FF0A0CC
MTLAVLSHRLLANDRVLITLVGEGGQTVTATVAGSYMRAKAWGLLADLDPAGVVDAALGQRSAVVPADRVGLSLASKITVALRDGAMTNRGLRRAIGGDVTARQINLRAHELIRRGLACRADADAGPGFAALYDLTAAGRARAEQLAPGLAPVRGAAA